MAFVMFFPVIIVLKCIKSGLKITEPIVKIEKDNDVEVDVEIRISSTHNQVAPFNKIEVNPMSAYKETKSEVTEKKLEIENSA